MGFTVQATAEAETDFRPARPDRKRLEGSDQQERFWSALLDDAGPILLEARAGTGKSTSCREGMWRLLERDPRLAIRYCCYNKKVADEFAAKSPPAADVGTMHRFGHEALRLAFRSQIQKDKTYLVLDDLGHAGMKRYVRRSVAKLVELAKNHALRPGQPDLEATIASFADRFDVECWGQPDRAVALACEVLARSAEMTAVLDFDDMLWLPVLHDVRFPSVDLLFIDECQDLNPVQHALAARLSGSGRAVVVGDPYQAIYGWRGADCDSMDTLREALGARVMPLTVTFRCPRSHVELARRFVPDFEAAPGAPEGELAEGGPELIESAGPGDMVLCRANAPLIAACLRQIARLVPAVVRGRAIGDSLLAIVRKVDEAPTTAAFARGVQRWKAKEVSRLEAKDGAEDLIEQAIDRAACLDAVASACASPGEIPGAIGRLFADDDSDRRVTFSSVHRAKGSEARHVVYLQIPYSEKRDRARPPQEWELQQRRNLEYVATTRSLNRLALVS